MAFVPEPLSLHLQSKYLIIVYMINRHHATPRHATMKEGRSGVACVPSPCVFTPMSRGLCGFSFLPLISIIIIINNGAAANALTARQKF